MARDAAGIIKALIEGKKRATESEVREIIARVGDAPFAVRLVSVPDRLKDVVYSGHRFGAKAPSNLVHLAKRVILEKQWKLGTTLDEYEQDLRSAIRHEYAHVVVYRSRGINHLAVLSPTIVPEARLGSASEKQVWVVYDADHDTIVTGYQVPGIEAVRLPKDARWLK